MKKQEKIFKGMTLRKLRKQLREDPSKMLDIICKGRINKKGRK